MIFKNIMTSSKEKILFIYYSVSTDFIISIVFYSKAKLVGFFSDCIEYFSTRIISKQLNDIFSTFEVNVSLKLWMNYLNKPNF